MSEKTNKNLFAKSPEVDKPKFRELVEQRMNKIMEEENYKAVENKKIDATSSLDSKGRPKTFRNIINQRVEDYSDGTLDIDSVDTTEIENYSTFVTNSINSNTTMPSSAKEKVLEDLKSKPKSRLTYTERKMLNQSSAGGVLDSVNSLGERRKQLESNDDKKNNRSQRQSEDYIEGVEIPVHFNRELKIIDPKSGEVITTRYKNTVEGRHDFVIWLKLNGIYDRVEKKLPPATGDQTVLKEKLDEEAKIKRVSIRATLQNESGFKVERPQPEKIKKPKQPKKGLMGGQITSDTLPRGEVTPTSRMEVKQTPKVDIKQIPKNEPQQTQKPQPEDRQYNTKNYPTLKLEEINKSMNDKSIMKPVPQPVVINKKQPRQNQNSKQVVNLLTRQPQNNKPNENSKQKMKKEISNVVQKAAKNIKHRTSGDEVSTLKKQILMLKQELLNKKVSRDVYNTTDFEIDVNQGFSDADVLFGLEEFEPNHVVKNSLQVVKSNIQPDTISVSIDMSRIIKLKAKLRENDSNFPFSSMAFVVKALSNALEKFPVFNSRFDNSSQQPKLIKKHNIGIIIETDEKTVVPVLDTANGLSIKELGTQLISITSDIRRGRKIAEEHSTIKVGTFVGSASFMKPTLGNENVAIIAISKIIKKPFEFGGKMYSKASMNLVLTYDQRISQNGQANEFISWIKYLLETPEILTLS